MAAKRLAGERCSLQGGRRAVTSLQWAFSLGTPSWDEGGVCKWGMYMYAVTHLCLGGGCLQVAWKQVNSGKSWEGVHYKVYEGSFK